MFGILPNRYDKKWILAAVIFTAVIWGVMVLSESLILKNETTSNFMIKALEMALVIGGLTALFGFLGARVLFAFSTLGVLVGITAMLYVYITGGEAKDFTGLSLLIMISIIGLILGVLGQIAAGVFKKKVKQEKVKQGN